MDRPRTLTGHPGIDQNSRPSSSASMAAVPDFDPTTPSIARVYDYLLHGKDNFAVDREVGGAADGRGSAHGRGDAGEPAVPGPRRDVGGEPGDQRSSSTWAAACRPCRTRTGQRRAIAAGARVAYLDNDAVVLSHLRALAAKGNPGVTVVDGDVREVTAILDAVAAGIDLSAHGLPADGVPAALLRARCRAGPGGQVRRGAGARELRRAVRRPRRQRCGGQGLRRLLRRGGAGVQPLGSRSSPASSARWNWCRRAWSTPGSGARTGSSPCTCRRATAR